MTTGTIGQTYEPQPKSLLRLHLWVKGFFVAYVIGFMLLGIGSAWFAASVPPGYDYNIDMLPAEWLLAVGGLIGLLALFGSIIFFSIFTFRAMKNLHVWGARNAEMSAGWAVGWYFIPIANLFKPYQGMDQILDGSHEVNGHPEPATSRLPLWCVVGSLAEFLTGSR